MVLIHNRWREANRARSYVHFENTDASPRIHISINYEGIGNWKFAFYGFDAKGHGFFTKTFISRAEAEKYAHRFMELNQPKDRWTKIDINMPSTED